MSSVQRGVVQENYKAYHASVFDEAGQLSLGLAMVAGALDVVKDRLCIVRPSFDGKDELCRMGLSKISFTTCIVFLWSVRMLNEVKSAISLSKELFLVPDTKEDNELVRIFQTERGEVESLQILAVGLPSRLLLVLTVTVPKVFVGMVLLVGGCRWFAATESWQALILNALALEFVISIDELIYEAFTPLTSRQTIEKTKLTRIKQDWEKEAKELDQKLISSLTWSLLQMLACIAWALLYLNMLQQVLPGFSHDVAKHCQQWLDKEHAPPCPIFGNPDTCFPYGE
ncbi:unnamed protein product [Effrenium voratum]|nr:unnamed protein product [Effrenium voratum]